MEKETRLAAIAKKTEEENEAFVKFYEENYRSNFIDFQNRMDGFKFAPRELISMQRNDDNSFIIYHEVNGGYNKETFVID